MSVILIPLQPVRACCGHTFERQALLLHLLLYRNKCPLDNTLIRFDEVTNDYQQVEDDARYDISFKKSWLYRMGFKSLEGRYEPLNTKEMAAKFENIQHLRTVLEEHLDEFWQDELEALMSESPTNKAFDDGLKFILKGKPSGANVSELTFLKEIGDVYGPVARKEVRYLMVDCIFPQMRPGFELETFHYWRAGLKGEGEGEPFAFRDHANLMCFFREGLGICMEAVQQFSWKNHHVEVYDFYGGVDLKPTGDNMVTLYIQGHAIEEYDNSIQVRE